jgi:hypothetical protein
MQKVWSKNGGGHSNNGPAHLICRQKKVPTNRGVSGKDYAY